MTFSELIIAGVLAFGLGVVANWFPKPAKLTSWGVAGIALVLILVTAMLNASEWTSSSGDGESLGTGTQAPPGDSTPQGTTKEAEPTSTVQTQQPSASFECDDTDNGVESVAMHPTGTFLACVTMWSKAIWNIESQPPSQAKNLGVGALAAAFAPDGSALLTAGNSCWDLFEGGQPWNQIGQSECGMEEQAHSVVFAPDGKTFATRPAYDGGEIRFWDVASRKITNTYTADNGKQVLAIAYSPRGQYFATGSEDAHPYLWDLSHGGQRTPLKDDRGGHSEAVYAVAFSPDGAQLVSGSGDRTAKLWNVSDGKPLASLTGEHDASVKAVAFSPDGRTVVTGGDDRKVIAWDIATGKPVRRLEGSGGGISSLSFDRNGKILAAGCSDAKVVVWSLT